MMIGQGHLRSGITRGLAGAVGGFALLNLIGGWLRPGFDANIWWIDLRVLPDAASSAVIGTAGMLFLWHALRPAGRGWRRHAVAAAAVLLALSAAANALTYYRLTLGGMLHAGPAVPLSLPLAGVFAWIAWHRHVRTGWRSAGTAITTCAAVALLGAFGLMWTFGQTDYRRPADAVVVFGCRAYADGRPSDALADRVNTAIALYQDGYADRRSCPAGPAMAITTKRMSWPAWRATPASPPMPSLSIAKASTPSTPPPTPPRCLLSTGSHACWRSATATTCRASNSRTTGRGWTCSPCPPRSGTR